MLIYLTYSITITSPTSNRAVSVRSESFSNFTVDPSIGGVNICDDLESGVSSSFTRSTYEEYVSVIGTFREARGVYFSSIFGILYFVEYS